MAIVMAQNMVAKDVNKSEFHWCSGVQNVKHNPKKNQLNFKR